MAVYFADSSALIKRYHREAGSERVGVLLDSAERIVISRLTQVEVSAAIVRRWNAATGAPQDLSALLARFERNLIRSFEIVEMSAEVVRVATALARRYGVRGADAIQLASALAGQDDASEEEFLF